MAHSPAQVLALKPEDERNEILSAFTEEQLADLMSDWSGFWARPEQLPPEWDWFIWAILAGRGFGKSRTGSETTIDEIIDNYLTIESGKRAFKLWRGALVGRTVGDVRSIMVEGESGLMACSEQRGIVCKYEPTKKKISWPDLGAMAETYTAEEPESLRGPQHHWFWADEMAAWSMIVDSIGNTAWTNLMLGLRLGERPRGIVTTTPKPIPQIKEIFNNAGVEKGHSIALTGGSMFDNVSNLPESFIHQIRSDYEGSALAAQEIYGLLMAEVKGAKWKMAWIDDNRWTDSARVPELIETAIAIDPAFSDSDQADETGIVVGGLFEPFKALNDTEQIAEYMKLPSTHPKRRRHAAILADLSCRKTTGEWAKVAVDAYWSYGCKYLIIESNLAGKQHMEEIIHAVDPNVRVIPKGASGSKGSRAAGPATMYEQGRVHHLGYFGLMESEMVTYIDGDKVSPNRMDAVVHLLTYFFPKTNQRPARSNAKALRERKVGPTIPR